jgi:hypothetical protein
MSLRASVLLLLSVMLMPTADADAQRRGGRGSMREMLGDPNEYYRPPDFTENPKYDGRFTFARIKYLGFECFSEQGPGWSHDYPRAEAHFMRIMRTVSTVRPFIEQGPIEGGNILALNDPNLFKYPVAYLSEPGGWRPNPDEVTGLRNYLTKGGFIIVDDFEENCTGGGDMMNFTAVMRQVLPTAKILPIPPEHPVFDSFYKINFDAFGGGRGRRGTQPQWFGVFQDNDPKKRLMVVANYLLDMGELMEYSDRGFNMVPTNEAYKLGVNYIIYALTH